MAHLGILLAWDHYPPVSTDPRKLDATLRCYLASLGHDIDEISVFACHDGAFPAFADHCDLWIVSGVPLIWDTAAQGHAEALRDLIRRLVWIGRPVYGLNHGEHLLHEALCGAGAARPDTPALPRQVRNPFQSFWLRDRLFRWQPETGSIVAAPRPEATTAKGVFGLRALADRAWRTLTTAAPAAAQGPA